jgi:hypothetical protein
MVVEVKPLATQPTERGICLFSNATEVANTTQQDAVVHQSPIHLPQGWMAARLPVMTNPAMVIAVQFVSSSLQRLTTRPTCRSNGQSVHAPN